MSEIIERAKSFILSCGDQTMYEAHPAVIMQGLVEAVERAEESNAHLFAIISDIREASGLGAKPMLNELAGDIKTLLSKYAWERDKAREERDEAERRSEAYWGGRVKP